MPALSIRRTSVSAVRPARRARGVVLIEVLIAILLFSIGVLGLIGLQATAVKNTSESQFRVEAALLADSLTAQMRTSPAVTRAVDFASPGGTRFAAWATGVTSSLPGAGANPPSVDTSNYPTVTITISWRALNDTGTRQLVTITTLD